MPRSDAGSAIGAALLQLRGQTTEPEYQRAVSFLLARATARRDARAGVYDMSAFRLQCDASFGAAIGRYAAAIPCLAALGFELTDSCDEFLLPAESLDTGRSNDQAIHAIIEELQASSSGAAGGGAARRSVADMLRRSFSGGGRASSLQEGLLTDAADSDGEALTRTTSTGAALARGISGTLRTTLGRTMSGGGGGGGGGSGGVVQEFSCPICLCNESVTESFTLACGHRFCRECVAGYVTSKINDNQLQMTCPDLGSSPVVSAHTPAPGPLGAAGGGASGFTVPTALADDAEDGAGLEEQLGCPFTVDTQVARMLVDDATRAKHDRFAQIRSNPLLRECPAAGCGALSQPRVNWRGIIVPEMSCEAEGCGTIFCYFHSNAHPGRTCKQYEQARRDEERAHRAALAEFTKPCPACKTPTEKNNGCNHMTCSAVINGGQVCGQNWCWICGSKCDGGGYPTHYAWWNVFGCPGTQMQDNYQHWSCCGQCGLRCGLLLYKLMLVVAVPVLAVVGLAVFVVCLPGLIVSVPVVLCCDCDDCDEDMKLCYMALVSTI